MLDPYIAIWTDEAAARRGEDAGVEARFRRLIVWMVISRLAGTLLAQALLVPCAFLVIAAARAI